MQLKALFLTIGTFVLVSSSFAKNDSGRNLVQISKEDSPAILQIDYWGEDGKNPEKFNVDGTGFLVGRDGYFITAAHVLERYKASTSQLGATVHQRDKSGSGHWFNVIEVDSRHDLALCQLLAFKLHNESERKKDKGRPESTYVPVSSLVVSQKTPESGELVATIGFPLGSFASPLIQAGNIAATDGLLKVVSGTPAGRGDLLIVSMSANHGNSGGPLISLETGEVVGMIIQYVPAPLLSRSDGNTRQDIPQQSGLMVAVPAKWILDILSRHGVTNAPIRASEHLAL